MKLFEKFTHCYEFIQEIAKNYNPDFDMDEDCDGWDNVGDIVTYYSDRDDQVLARKAKAVLNRVDN